MALQMLSAADDALRAMKQAERGDLLGVWFLSLRAVGDPKQAPGQLSSVEEAQDECRQLLHQGLRRDAMPGEEIRDARRLIVGRGKDAGPHGSKLGFADEQADKQVVKMIISPRAFLLQFLSSEPFN